MFFFSDDEACSIMMSPFEKKLYLRQEDLLCSQAVDSQCEVRWDCTSPDAIRHLKKSKMFGSDRPSLKTFLSCLHFHFSVGFFGQIFISVHFFLTEIFINLQNKPKLY